MTKEDAIKLLDEAPQSAEAPSAVNAVFSQQDAVAVVRAWVDELKDGAEIPSRGMQKRVWQVHRNQRRPRFDMS